MISVVGRSDGTAGVGLSRRWEERDERDRETDKRPKIEWKRSQMTLYYVRDLKRAAHLSKGVKTRSLGSSDSDATA